MVAGAGKKILGYALRGFLGADIFRSIAAAKRALKSEPGCDLRETMKSQKIPDEGLTATSKFERLRDPLRNWSELIFGKLVD